MLHHADFVKLQLCPRQLSTLGKRLMLLRQEKQVAAKVRCKRQSIPVMDASIRAYVGRLRLSTANACRIHESTLHSSQREAERSRIAGLGRRAMRYIRTRVDGKAIVRRLARKRRLGNSWLLRRVSTHPCKQNVLLLVSLCPCVPDIPIDCAPIE